MIRTKIGKISVILILILTIGVGTAAAAPAHYLNALFSLNQSCVYGAKVTARGSGIGTATFYTSKDHTQYIRKQLDFGNGMSRTFVTSTTATYWGVRVQGNGLTSAGGAGCRTAP